MITQGFIFLALFIVLLFVIFGLSKKNNFFRKILIVSYIISMAVYLIWRIFYTLPDMNAISFVLGILLLIAEIGGFLLSFVFYFLFFNENQKEKKSLEDLNNQYPSIDVYIATYNEDELILKRAVLAAKNMRYPKLEQLQIYILDDGSRPTIEALAKDLAVNYISRETHEHAKAGNLNHALALTKGELIVTLDADMVPRVDFLEKMVGYFANPKMGFVQAPQTFFNDDPYQFNFYARDYLSNDQDFFMRRIEAQKDIYNSVMYVGSNAIFSRQCLKEIGGFSTGVITEDMATGMLIQAKGFETRFVNENLASGLAPETFGDLIKQRDRWSRGNIQVARKFNPLKMKGLNMIQKLLYADGIHYWFSGIYKMIFLLAPIWFILLGFYSLNADFNGIIYFWLPSFLVSQLAFNRISQGKQAVLVSNVYETVMAPFMSYAVIGEAVFRTKHQFVVTNKGKNSHKAFYNWKIATPILVLLCLSLAALIKCILILTNHLTFNGPDQAIYINFFWLLYNLIALSLAALLPFERPRFRKAERFYSDKPVEIFDEAAVSLVTGQLIDWNELGARIKINDKNKEIFNNDQKLLLKIDGYLINSKFIRISDLSESAYSISIIFESLSEKNYAYIVEQTYAKPSDEIPLEDKTNRISLIIYAILIQNWRSFKKVILRQS
ncbi:MULTISPECIES: cellulose synthase catalytic subunit [unclassified Enterococcus]|uniref:glycosyltransferase family 2 protein n=1 Tax=unclassified Enterococcus TaxID=2608891 RepID=UPI0015541A4C|nr:MULTISPECIES: cellulose synthase catalytic subunit [unclassified Enterococcus]MBS7576610.1 glycosyltransferase [Enterococcus sp. MMGLQ5-2]MBS7583903.1 glycosyltransferase [Enterococcus sp. MMGLQ5-1]NPD11764.1 glycosyltransferase [Enterococcus sp. MMGLQ5-1]NPD36447.1 glycosyltransferase [Enterococcus sp. MMGLQ5-2]